uniref:Uncharacterized protein n=1 Tax=Oryza sativa subsp. japonica TaxID=39947 RepID=Q6H3Y5_ORYSJ|nr:hypothetical protein [Oryza sativa Japonica Group]
MAPAGGGRRRRVAGGGEEARCAGAKGCGSLEEEDEWAWILGVGGLVLIGYGKSTPKGIGMPALGRVRPGSSAGNGLASLSLSRRLRRSSAVEKRREQERRRARE